jgi:hypothetical protein
MSFKKLLLLALASSVLMTAAYAAPLCVGNILDASQFVAAGTGGCQFGNIIYYNFSYGYANSASTAVPSNAVSVSFSNTGGDPARPTITFAANWDAFFADITDIRIQYSAAIVGGAPIVGANMTLSGSFGFAPPDPLGSFVSGAETVFLDVPGSGLAHVTTGIQPTSGTPFGPMSASSGDVGFAPQTQVSISKDIQLFAGFPPDDALLTRIDQELILSGPEPGTYVTFGGGLLGLAFFMRKRGLWRSRI